MEGRGEELYDALQFDGLTDPDTILDAIEDGFRDAGATHFLASGFPLPGRPIEPLVLRVNWGDLQSDKSQSLAGLTGNDPLLRVALGLHRSVTDTASGLLDGQVRESLLVTSAGVGGSDQFVVVPIKGPVPYQAAIVATGREFCPNGYRLGLLDFFCVAGIRRLITVKAVETNRPGGLTLRERRVVELSALGLTAQEIADQLRISQRTVHAHLQNASTKLMAGNKTQTVVEALRYGQIAI